jgi:hypothetical protein
MIIMEDSNNLFCSSNLPWSREIISWTSIENMGTRPQKCSPALIYSTGNAFQSLRGLLYSIMVLKTNSLTSLTFSFLSETSIRMRSLINSCASACFRQLHETPSVYYSDEAKLFHTSLSRLFNGTITNH